MACGGQHTNEEKSHISTLKVASRVAPSAATLPSTPHTEEEV